MKIFLLCLGLHFGLVSAHAAVLTINYDATQGVSGLTAASQVYLQSGANDIAGPLDGSTWNYVVGNWGNADGIGEMTNLGNNQWTITFDPIAYYNMAANGPVAGTSIQRIGMVFRNADGSLTGKDANNADIFIDLSGASPLVYNSDGTPFGGVTVLYTQSTFSTVNLSGFNADVVANGYGYPYTTTTADIDGFSDYLIDGTIDVLGGDPPPTEYLPYDGIINSTTSIGNKFQLQNYSANNSLRLDYQGAAGTLNFTVPRRANEIFVMGNSGSGASTCDITVNFTDLTSQTFTGINFSDWFYATPYTVKGIGLAYCCGVNPQAGVDNPRMYESMLPLDAGNFTKLISDISISKTNAAGILNIFAVSISTTENSNDLICNATHMALGVFYSGDNTSANPIDPRDNDVANAGYQCSTPNNTLWYSYTPLINGNYEIVSTSSATTGLDAWVGHFSSTDCNGTLIFYNCFKGTNIGDTVVNSTSLNAGETYFFMIDGFSGAIGDFSIALRESACTSPPNAGNALASSSSVCLYDVVHFSLSGNSGGLGQTYQWQKSPDDINWTNIAGATQDQIDDTIKAATYYRCEITCSGFSTASLSVQVVLKPYLQCYCISSALYNNLYDIGNVKIMALNTGTIYLNNGDSINSVNNSTAINQYTDFTGLPATNLQTGVPYSISVTNINANSYRYQGCTTTLFIDLNHNGIFDHSTEAFQIGYAPPAQNIKTATVIIPSSALPGITRMRFVLNNLGSSNQDACGTYSAGETEDYLVNLSAGPSCINPANAGQATASSFSVCPIDEVTLSLIGSFSTGVGLTFKWQKSVDLGANWTFIAGATNATYTGDSLGGARYRCALKCNFGSTVYSNYVDIANNPGNQCYCYSGSIYFQTGNDNIGNVTIASLNNGNDTAATLNPSSIVPYTDFTDLPPTSLTQGITYPISLTQIDQWGYYNCSFYVFIDFNQDGVFNLTDEYFYIGPTSYSPGGNTITGNIAIPASALPGATRMRIILIEGGGAGAPSPCSPYSYGETEDYTVSILCGPLTLSNAGPDQTNICGVSTNLSGNSPVLGVGVWTLSSGTGAVIANSSNPASAFTGIAGVPYILEWTIGTSPGCSTSNDFTTVTFMKAPPAQICYATVDTAYAGDTVVKIFWQKPIESYVAGYVIYREKAGQGFVPVATVSNALFSSYADSSARPTQQAERYKIATIDSCGNSTDVPSALAHQTILLQGSIDVTGSLVNLDWDAYIGINDPTRYYTVMRDNLGNGVWDSIAATPWSITAANIGSANLYPNANYAVDLVWQGTCTPSQRMMAGFNKTRSNIKNRNALPVGITKNFISKAITVFPNPTKNEVTISGLDNNVKEIELLNLLGEKCIVPVYWKREGERATIDVSKMPPGVYTIQIKSVDFIEIRKLVIE